VYKNTCRTGLPISPDAAPGAGGNVVHVQTRKLLVCKKNLKNLDAGLLHARTNRNVFRYVTILGDYCYII
jgi:hypothetical protein